MTETIGSSITSLQFALSSLYNKISGDTEKQIEVEKNLLTLNRRVQEAIDRTPPAVDDDYKKVIEEVQEATRKVRLAIEDTKVFARAMTAVTGVLVLLAKLLKIVF